MSNTFKSVRLRWSRSPKDIYRLNNSGAMNESWTLDRYMLIEYPILSESLVSISEYQYRVPSTKINPWLLRRYSAEIFTYPGIPNRSSPEMRDPNEDAWTTDLQTVCSILPNPWSSARRSSLGITRSVKAWGVSSSWITDADGDYPSQLQQRRKEMPCSGDEYMVIHFPFSGSFLFIDFCFGVMTQWREFLFELFVWSPSWRSRFPSSCRSAFLQPLSSSSILSLSRSCSSFSPPLPLSGFFFFLYFPGIVGFFRFLSSIQVIYCHTTQIVLLIICEFIYYCWFIVYYWFIIIGLLFTIDSFSIIDSFIPLNSIYTGFQY